MWTTCGRQQHAHDSNEDGSAETVVLVQFDQQECQVMVRRRLLCLL